MGEVPGYVPRKSGNSAPCFPLWTDGDLSMLLPCQITWKLVLSTRERSAQILWLWPAWERSETNTKSWSTRDDARVLKHGGRACSASGGLVQNHSDVICRHPQNRKVDKASARREKKLESYCVLKPRWQVLYMCNISYGINKHFNAVYLSSFFL